jgi:type I restriction enzyme S subunit
VPHKKDFRCYPSRKKTTAMLEKKLVPKLRFAEFDGEWLYKKYNQIYTFYTTNSFSRDNLNYEGGDVKNIHYGDIHTKFATLFNITKEKVPFVNGEIDLSKIKEQNFCKEGDLLIADASEDYMDIGKTIEIIYLNDQRLISGLHTFHARPNKYNMAIGFSGYLLQSWKVRKQVMTIAQGTKVLGLATTRLGNVDLIITSTPEQQKIASFLIEVDTKLSQLTKKKALLEDYKKGVMQQIFSQQLRFKDGNGNDYGDWEEKKLGEVCDVRDGTHDSPKYVKDGYPLITSKNLNTNGKLDFEDVSFVNGIDFININKRSKVDVNDIIFGMIGTIGNPVLLKEDGFAIKNVALIKEKKQLKNIFLIDFLKSNHIAKQFHRQNSGGTQKFIALGVIRNLKVLIPSLKEQTKIADFLSNLDTKIELLSTNIENTQTFKKGLLQQLFV